MYATYEDYLSYGGGMSEADYTGCGARASRMIDANTFDRAACAPPCMSARLQACCCELSDLLHSMEKMNAATAMGALSAATNDGMSESYGSYKDASNVLRAQMQTVLRRWLTAPVNLMYAGVM